MFVIAEMTPEKREMLGQLMATLAGGVLGATMIASGYLRQRQAVPTTPAQARLLKWGGLALVVACLLKLVAPLL